MKDTLCKIKSILPTKEDVIRLFSGFVGDSDEHFLKRIVARHSRGNIGLQLGRFMTTREYEAQKKRVLTYDFR